MLPNLDQDVRNGKIMETHTFFSSNILFRFQIMHLLWQSPVTKFTIFVGRFTYLSISAEESVGEWHADVKANRLENGALHGEEIVLGVGIITDVQEVSDKGRAPLLHIIYNIMNISGLGDLEECGCSHEQCWFQPHHYMTEEWRLSFNVRLTQGHLCTMPVLGMEEDQHIWRKPLTGGK